jgi:hypothetical protein
VAIVVEVAGPLMIDRMSKKATRPAAPATEIPITCARFILERALSTRDSISSSCFEGA